MAMRPSHIIPLDISWHLPLWAKAFLLAAKIGFGLSRVLSRRGHGQSAASSLASSSTTYLQAAPVKPPRPHVGSSAPAIRPSTDTLLTTIFPSRMTRRDVSTRTSFLNIHSTQSCLVP
ncbi:hypothetical protein ACJQWK_06813 [Exserohilum turcicum]